MSRIPSVGLQTAFRNPTTGEVRAGKPIEVTSAVVKMMLRKPGLMRSRSEPEYDVEAADWLYDVALSRARTWLRAYRQPGEIGEVITSHPAFLEQIEDMATELGHLRNASRLAKFLERVAAQEGRLREARKEWFYVRLGEWREPKEFPALYSPHAPFDGAFRPGMDWAADMGWRLHEFIREHPEPGHDTPEMVSAWNQAYQAFVRGSAPPFAFGTVARRWPGVDARSVLTCLREADKVQDIDAHAVLNRALYGYPGSALDSVVDIDELDMILSEWQQGAACGQPDDEALAQQLADWNARQHVVLHKPDRRFIVPMFPRVTREECLDWCIRNARAEADKLDTLKDSWSVVAAELKNEPSQESEAELESTPAP